MDGPSLVSRLDDSYNAILPAYGYKLTHLAIPNGVAFKGLPQNPRRFQLSISNSGANTVFFWFDSSVANGVGNGAVSNSNWNYYFSLHGSLVTSEVWFFAAVAGLSLHIVECLLT